MGALSRVREEVAPCEGPRGPVAPEGLVYLTVEAAPPFPLAVALASFAGLD